MRNAFKYSFAVGGILLTHFSHATYSNPGSIADMPAQTQSFVNRLTTSGNQAQYLSNIPNGRRAMVVLENYYQSRLQNFTEVLNKNVRLIKIAENVAAEAARAGGKDNDNDTIGECLRDNRDWRDMRKAFEVVSRLPAYAGSAAINTFERVTLGNEVTTAYYRLSEYLNPESSESMANMVEACCKKNKDVRKDFNVCKEDYLSEKLAPLADLEKLPSNYVDPLNPGRFAPTLTAEDVVSLMALGQMQDFVDAKDYNSQVAALINADSKCSQAREEALSVLNKRGEMKLNIFTGINVLQCSMASFLKNSSSSARQIGLAAVNAEFPVFGRVSACPQQVKDAAVQMLTYSPEMFQSQFHHLSVLPGNISESTPIAKPIDISSIGDDLVLDLRDEAGFTRDSMYISSNLNANYQRLMALNNSNTGATGSGIQVVSSSNYGEAGGSPFRRSAARSIVNGVGTRRAASERTLVRTLAQKASEGDLESARTLAGAVRSRKEQMKMLVGNAKKDRSLASSRRATRAAKARGLVEQSLALDTVRETSKTFKKAYSGLYRALNLSSSDVSGRVVERPGSGSTSTSGGSTATSQLQNYSDRTANQAYKDTRAQQALVKIKNSIRSMAESINSVGARLNQIIKQKMDLIQKFKYEFDPQMRYAELRNMGMSDRTDKLVSLNKRWASVVKEVNILNTQELGMRAALSTAKMSFTNFIAGAEAFQGLDVRRGNVRGPAAYNDPNFAANNNGVQPQLNPMPGPNYTMPQGTTPPAFNPSDVLRGNLQGASFFKVFDIFNLPYAQAAEMSPEEKRLLLVKEFGDFMKNYDSFINRVEEESVATKQKAWEQYILNEREMKKEALLSSEERVILGGFNDAVKEEIPDLVKMKNLKTASGNDGQIYQYIEQIRADSAELNEVMAQEATISLDSKSMDPKDDDESWTGMLPAISLQ